MMDWPDLAGEPAGSTFRRAIYVATEYPSLTVAWQVLAAGAEVLVSGAIACAAPSNSLQKVGEISWNTPAAGSYRVVLTLERNAETLSTNSYAVQARAGV